MRVYPTRVFVIVAVAMFIGALTSAAWVARPPYCYIISFVAWVLFCWIKGVN